MNKNLAIDIGNSRAKYAVFDADKLLTDGVWPDLEIEKLKTLVQLQKVEKAIISSTRELTSELVEEIKSILPSLFLNHLTPLPVNIAYKTPETLGKDRVAALVGARFQFPNQNCLVIDAGTCITLDLLTANGTFAGGNISPGIEMRLNAMHDLTAKLPLVKRNYDALPLENWLGDSTENALLNGAEWGAIFELRSFIKQTRQKYSLLKVIVTGGDADFFGKTLKTKIFVRPRLVLTGLIKILQHNV
jgi:type III pantothenate kinase